MAVGFAEKKSKTDENKREGEQSVALKLYAETNLEGATVTGDALNNNKPQAHAITQTGGHYFIQLKNENRHAYQAADRLAQEGSPLLPTQKNSTLPTSASTSKAQKFTPSSRSKQSCPGAAAGPSSAAPEPPIPKKSNRSPSSRPIIRPKRDAPVASPGSSAATGPATMYATTGCETTACAKPKPALKTTTSTALWQDYAFA